MNVDGPSRANQIKAETNLTLQKAALGAGVVVGGAVAAVAAAPVVAAVGLGVAIGSGVSLVAGWLWGK